MKGMENKVKYYEAYDELKPLLVGRGTNNNREISRDNPFYL